MNRLNDIGDFYDNWGKVQNIGEAQIMPVACVHHYFSEALG